MVSLIPSAPLSLVPNARYMLFLTAHFYTVDMLLYIQTNAIHTWDLKHPFINGCFNWMMNQIFTYLYKLNGWKSPLPSIKKMVGFWFSKPRIEKKKRSHISNPSANPIATWKLFVWTCLYTTELASFFFANIGFQVFGSAGVTVPSRRRYFLYFFGDPVTPMLRENQRQENLQTLVTRRCRSKNSKVTTTLIWVEVVAYKEKKDIITLPETNIAPENRPSQKETNIPFQPSIFRVFCC